MLQNRREILKEDVSIQMKCEYLKRCKQYLIFHSKNSYEFDDMSMDEIIEYSHKLHFRKCIDIWIETQFVKNLLKIHPSKIFIPFDEFDFDNFEMIHGQNNNNIAFSIEIDCNYNINNHDEEYEKCNCDIFHNYVMDYSIWSSFINYDNEIQFSINSDFTIIDQMIEYVHIYHDDNQILS